MMHLIKAERDTEKERKRVGRERENAQAKRLMWVLLWEVVKSSWESRLGQTTGCFVTNSICTTVTFAKNRIRLALFKPAVFR